MANGLDLHDFDMAAFSEVVATCTGDVFMVTAEGDKLNLKSKLCQLIGLTTLIQGGTVAEAKIICTNPEDESKLFRFNLFGEK
ncbi:MAG: hypothetical protein PHG02_04440 [Oscillospiraceae bacterium]|nr:hypothetical protein [Oscillospiraceae bacterium]